MDSEQSKALEEELSKLTILKLRDLAHKNGVEISGTIRKKDIIDKLIASGVKIEAVREIAETKKLPAEKAAEPRAKEGGRAETEIIQKLPEKVEVTEQKITEVREFMKSILGNRPSFFKIDGEVEAAIAKYDSGDYYGAIQDIQKARQKAADVYANFRIFTNAVGINASEKVLSEAVAKGAIAEERKKDLIDSAMITLVDSNAARREEAFDRLERGALSSYDKIIGDIGSDIQLLQKKAADLKELGANIAAAVDAISEADRLRINMQIDQAKLALAKANEMLRQAEKARSEELKYSIPRVRSMIEDAKLLGLDITDAEKELDKASYYLERGELKACFDALTKAGNGADVILNQRLASDTTLRQDLLNRAKMTVQQIGPSLMEAHSFAIDTSEAYHYISNAQIALNRQDPINAMKYSRRADELAKQFADDVKILKEKSVHVDKLRCAKCGQDMLYDYINGIRRCANCGTVVKK